MKISFNWLKNHIKFPKEITADQIAEILTNIGLEVEKIHKKESIKGGLEGVFVGYILECERHSNADKLKITKVDLGSGEPLQIVCGAPNVAKGQKVLVATEKTTLYPISGENFKIKKSKIRGEDSCGMICAEDELGIGNSHDGIMVLNENAKIGMPAAEFLKMESDYIFEIGLTPNRADAMSHYGVARDLYVYFKHKGQKLELNDWKESISILGRENIKINVDKNIAPNYLGVIIKNIKINDSPKWLKDRLESIDILPKNNIVDITNFVLHDIGQPLHAFDFDLIEGAELNVRFAKKGEKLIALDEKEYELTVDDLIIADARKPICFGGVMGGLNSSITQKTKNIFIECAYFDPVMVRKTAKRYGFNTDASFRFERGIDINKTKISLEKAIKLILEISGGDISSNILGEYKDDFPDFKVTFNYEKAKKIIGKEIPLKEIETIFLALGIKIEAIVKNDWLLSVPNFRVDIQRQEDLVEEILRIYGYDNIEPNQNIIIPFIESTEMDSFYKIKENISEHLTSLGFFEIMNNSLVNEKYNLITNITEEENIVRLKNALSKELSVMRSSLLFGGLESISLNINHKNRDIKFFEIGKIYKKEQENFIEKNMLSIFISGNKNKETWNNQNQKTDFFHIKGIIENICNKYQIDFDQKIGETKNIFEESVTFYARKNKLIEFGIIKKSILKEFDIKQDVFYAELDMDFFYSVLKNKKYNTIKEISKYPSVKRDLAMVLDKNIEYKSIKNIAFEVEKNILKEVNLFDIYIGDKIPNDKKSYAISFILQDDSKTLSENDINNSISKIQRALEEKLEITLRQ